MALKKKYDALWEDKEDDSPLSERQRIVRLIKGAMCSGARQKQACEVIELSARTFQRWVKDASRVTDVLVPESFAAVCYELLTPIPPRSKHSP